MTDDAMTRRRFTAATAGAAALGALGGCSASSREEAELALAKEPRPSRDLLTDWTETGRETGQVIDLSTPVTTLRGYEHTVYWSEEALRRRLRERTLGQFDDDVRVFVASRVTLRPSIDDIPLEAVRETVREQAAVEARSAFEAELADAGVRDVRVVDDGTMEVADGRTATLRVYEGRFDVSPVSVPITETREFTVELEPLEIEGLLAVWDDGEDVLVAGGAHPGAEYDRAVQHDLTDAVSVEVGVNLGFEPDRYRAELEELVASVR